MWMKVRKLASGLIAVCTLMGVSVLLAPPAKSQRNGCFIVTYGCAPSVNCNIGCPVQEEYLWFCVQGDSGYYYYQVGSCCLCT